MNYSKSTKTFYICQNLRKLFVNKKQPLCTSLETTSFDNKKFITIEMH